MATYYGHREGLGPGEAVGGDEHRERPGAGHAAERRGPHPPHQAHRPAGGDLDLHLWMMLLELFDERRKDVEADRHPAHHRDRAGQHLLAIGDARRRVADVVEDAVAELEQRFAGGGDLHAAPQPHEQPLVELVLEQQNLAADGGLRHVQAGPGRRERPRFRDGLDDFELPEIHRPIVGRRQL